MNLDWTIIGVIIALLAGIISFLQLIRTPKPISIKKESDGVENNKLKKAQKAIENNDLFLYLKWKYRGEPILERCGYIYPVVVYPSPDFQREDTESVLKLPLIRHEPEIGSFLVNNSEYLDLVNSLKQGRGLTLGKDVNTDTYAMTRLLTGERLQLECNQGHYFSTFRSCEALEWEIRSNIQKLKGSQEQDFVSFDKQLPLRKNLHAKVDNPVKDGSGRSPAIGISTLIAYVHDGSIKLLTKRRAKKGVPLRAGLLHVIPGFMFQPTTDYIDYEFNVIHNVFREYLEELFNFPENFEKSSSQSFLLR